MQGAGLKQVKIDHQTKIDVKCATIVIAPLKDSPLVVLCMLFGTEFSGSHMVLIESLNVD